MTQKRFSNLTGLTATERERPIPPPPTHPSFFQRGDHRSPHFKNRSAGPDYVLGFHTWRQSRGYVNVNLFSLDVTRSVQTTLYAQLSLLKP